MARRGLLAPRESLFGVRTGEWLGFGVKEVLYRDQLGASFVVRC